jgi:hypothetical protein
MGSMVMPMSVNFDNRSLDVLTLAGRQLDRACYVDV